MNTILAGRFLKGVSHLQGIVILLFLGAISGLLSSNSRWLINCLSSFTLFTVYIGLSFILFKHYGIALPIISPVLVILLTYLLVSIYQVKIKQGKIFVLELEKNSMLSELNVVNSSLIQKEAQFVSISNELNNIEGQVAENNKKGKEHLIKIADLEAKIENIVRKRDRLKKKKELLDKKISDFEIRTIIKTTLPEDDLEALRKECESLGIITENRAMLEIFRRLKKAAAVNSSILILGEPGTGKEVFARAIHKLSNRREREMVTVNLPAIPESLMESELFGHIKGAFTGATAARKGKFEEADKSTIFLDEIGEMKLELQSKLLRVLQNREFERVGENKRIKVDLRVISATNKDLQLETEMGKFRKDLFSRLNVIKVKLLPLRERREDIEPLAQFFLNHFNREHNKTISGISKKAIDRLKSYHWEPGNIRDLMHTIERGAINADGKIITENDLDLQTDESLGDNDTKTPQPAKTEESGDILSDDMFFLNHVRKNKFEIGKTARDLDINRGTAASRFKGICFQYLVNNDFNIHDTSGELAGNQDSGLSVMIEKKVEEYYSNLIDMILEFDNSIDAIKKCMPKFKNLPQKYHPFVKEIVERHFKR